MSMKEKPIIRDNSRLADAMRESMAKHGVTDNPYDSNSPERKKALQYLKDRKLKIKRLRYE